MDFPEGRYVKKYIHSMQSTAAVSWTRHVFHSAVVAATKTGTLLICVSSDMLMLVFQQSKEMSLAHIRLECREL